VVYHLKVLQDTKEIVLDTMDLDTVTVTYKGSQLEHTIDKPVAVGNRMVITLPEIVKKGENTQFEIVSTTSKAKSLTWGDFVFTQNQPIYCRSLFPCQDTPSCKAKFET
jgi:leukotriene-A4 hydrolase